MNHTQHFKCFGDLTTYHVVGLNEVICIPLAIHEFLCLCFTTTGTKETLKTIPESKGMKVREQLLAFHSKYYSSNIMALAVLGAEPVEELQQMVVDMFSSITNKGVHVRRYAEQPYRKEDMQVSDGVLLLTRFLKSVYFLFCGSTRLLRGFVCALPSVTSSTKG